jgi:uridine kinase
MAAHLPYGAVVTRPRLAMMQTLADAVVSLQRPHSVRVAIDGIDNAGKTVLADELAALVERRGRPVLRASIDGFHRPRAERLRRGALSAPGYFYDSFDYEALRRCLLEPLGPGGDMACRTAVFDLDADRAIESAPIAVSADAVLVFDGVFLQRSELGDCWDLVVFVEISFEEALRRARHRDRKRFWGELEVRYLKRYLPGQRIYLEQCRPAEHADFVVDNSKPERPRLLAQT